MAAPTQLIVGLGNPGPEYVWTRHNAGFLVLNAYATAHDAPFMEVAKYQAEIAEVVPEPGRRILLVKPSTYMNLSGQSVGPLASFFKLAPKDVWVVQDDVDLEIGRLRLKIGGGGHGGHNGIKSIEAALGSNAFPRLKVGVAPGADDPRAQAETRDIVLGKFSEHELSFVIPPTILGAVTALENMVQHGPVKAASMMGT